MIKAIVINKENKGTKNQINSSKRRIKNCNQFKIKFHKDKTIISNCHQIKTKVIKRDLIHNIKHNNNNNSIVITITNNNNISTHLTIQKYIQNFQISIKEVNKSLKKSIYQKINKFNCNNRILINLNNNKIKKTNNHNSSNNNSNSSHSSHEDLNKSNKLSKEMVK